MNVEYLHKLLFFLFVLIEAEQFDERLGEHLLRIAYMIHDGAV